MNEVRGHSERDIRAMFKLIEQEREAQEKAERRRKAHAASRALSR